MPIENFNGKRLISFYKEEPDYIREGSPAQKSARTEVPAAAMTDDEISLSSLPEDILCNVLSCLDVNSLLRTRCINRSFRTLASQADAGWENLCQKLWVDKVFVLREAREHPDPMAGYRLSLEDSRSRDFVNPEELLYDPVTKTGTVWSFRFKESAGMDWTSWDPWYNGRPCRKMVFLEDGTVKEFRPDDAIKGEGELEDPPFSDRMAHLFDPPMAMRWRYLSRPLDMPARPRGSYLRFSVGGRDVPTYCVRRSPTKNWGFVMESCWGVYASFELPKRVPKNRRRSVRLREAQDAVGNWFNVHLETSDDEQSTESDDGNGQASLSRLLIDEDTFVVTSGLQWREAFMYNFGARELPEGEDAIASFERAYAFINA